MATAKKAKKKTGTKATSAKKKAAPKKAKVKTARKVSTSAKAVAARSNFKAAHELAIDAIYDAGKKGARKPSWGQALRAAYRGESLSGTKKR